MGPMANPHNLAPPGTVFVLGTAQAYGDRGSNMPHLKLQLRALGLIDTGLKPQLIARLQLSDAGQSPTTDWTAFDGRDSTDLDAGARVYSALDLAASVAILQTSPAFATSFGAEPAVLATHIPALGAPDDAIALRLLHLFAADKDLNAAAVPVAGPPGAGAGPAAAGLADDAQFRDREAEALLFMLDNPDQPGSAELTEGGAGDALTRKASLHLRISLRKGAFVVADWIKDTVAAVQPSGASASRAGAGLLPPDQAQQVTRIMQSTSGQLESQLRAEIQAQNQKIRDELADTTRVSEQIQMGMRSIDSAHPLHKRRMEVGEEVAQVTKLMRATREDTREGGVPAPMQQLFEDKSLEYAVLNKTISANDQRSLAVYEVWDRERKSTGSAGAALGKASDILDKERKANAQWERGHGHSQWGGRGNQFGGVVAQPMQGMGGGQLYGAGYGYGGQQYGGHNFGGQPYGGQGHAGAQYSGQYLAGQGGAQSGGQFGGAATESFAAPVAQMGMGAPPPPPFNAPGGPGGNLPDGRQPYAPPAMNVQLPRFHTLPGGDVRLVTSDGTRLVNLKLGRSQQPPFFLYKNLGLAPGEVRAGGGPCNFCGAQGHESFECSILRSWFHEGKVNAQGHPTRRW